MTLLRSVTGKATDIAHGTVWPTDSPSGGTDAIRANMFTLAYFQQEAYRIKSYKIKSKKTANCAN
jgi:hypothetical protein